MLFPPDYSAFDSCGVSGIKEHKEQGFTVSAAAFALES